LFTGILTEIEKDRIYISEIFSEKKLFIKTILLKILSETSAQNFACSAVIIEAINRRVRKGIHAKNTQRNAFNLLE